MRQEIDTLMEYIQKCKSMVVITGAGISTKAGIPDFRSQNGIYRQGGVNETLFHIEAFREDPATFYKTFAPLYTSILNAQPTYTHHFLKRLEELGRLKTIITQNIDGLHHKAGSKNVIEIHGHLRQWDCLECRASYDTSEEIEKHVQKGEIPRCVACGGVLKPHVVFFGEYVMGLEKAMQAVQTADLLVVLGSSLVVYPVAGLPGYREEESHFVIINREPTPLDEEAEIVIHEDMDEVLKHLGFL
ncbi:NAD-dependent protein deacylase [Thermospira aquatica]|uniref:protein acetyllysine N-acetyltransferase n=1 Tax=Thermospira aquatica TaxID=2828656 RepID=A0AAX3BDA5_9SPIR|nr:NAD-dependent protein deacylase [Thermospira aquatica]URA10170.1 NAD-dependent protein deacylase [Thermospira aquatica]